MYFPAGFTRRMKLSRNDDYETVKLIWRVLLVSEIRRFPAGRRPAANGPVRQRFGTGPCARLREDMYESCTTAGRPYRTALTACRSQPTFHETRGPRPRR